VRDTNFNIAPNASSILGSLRNIGYDLKVALADLVDNSITALNNSNKSYKFIEICNNDISTSFPNLEWLSIVDNGIGMSENELINAFRLGGEGVDKDRGDKDLGRFGLGLKTASFSQCKKLTVISKKVDNEICALVFDLDAIEVSENWEVQRLSSEKQEYFFSAILERLENKDILNQESWTIVIWEKFDKLQISIKQSFYSELEKVRKHFSLVFHKFNGEINIFSNRTKIEYWDPFSYGVSDQKKLLVLDPNSAENISICGHLLKHRSEFQNDLEYELQSSVGTFLNNQGFFVYRNKRLIYKGGWLDLFNLEPHYNFARIEVDLSNSKLCDKCWNVDISKSSVRIPEFSKQEIINECNSIRKRAYNIYRYHGGLIQHQIGKSRVSKPISPIWYCERIGNDIGDKDVFKINREHLFVKEFESKLETRLNIEFNSLVTFLEKFLPVDSIFARKSNNELEEIIYAQQDLFENFIQIMKQSLKNGINYELAFDYLVSFEPFNKIKFDEEMKNELANLN